MSPAKLLARGVTFSDCELMGVEWAELGTFPDLAFRGCDLRYASFVSLVLEPAQGNKLAGARVPVETAIRLAESFGLKVA